MARSTARRLDRVRRLAAIVPSLAIVTLLGCEPPAAPPASTGDGGSTTSSASDATAATTPETEVQTGRRGYEIPIMQLEYWPDTTVPKYRYEMRFDPPETPGGRAKLHRNGWAWAYYGNGQLERQGSYRYTAANDRSERVGIWTYYTPEGEVERTEDRGGEVVWTAPDQRIAPPGTTP